MVSPHGGDVAGLGKQPGGGEQECKRRFPTVSTAWSGFFCLRERGEERDGLGTDCRAGRDYPGQPWGLNACPRRERQFYRDVTVGGGSAGDEAKGVAGQPFAAEMSYVTQGSSIL